MDKNQQKKQQIEQMRKYAMHHYFTPNARQRLGNIKLVNIQKYNKIVDMAIAMAQNNDLKSPINDGELKQLLKQTSAKKRFNITRK